MVVIHQLRHGLSRMSIWVGTVCVLARLLSRPTFPTFSRIHMLVVIEIPVLVFVEMGLHVSFKDVFFRKSFPEFQSSDLSTLSNIRVCLQNLYIVN